jgi:hypothetical protein
MIKQKNPNDGVRNVVLEPTIVERESTGLSLLSDVSID